LVWACALASALGACAGDDEEVAVAACVSASSVAATVPPEAARGRPAVAIAARDDHFVPECVETAGPGEMLVVLRNEGRHPHNLTVPGAGSVSVDGGQAAVMVVVVGREGLRYVCTIHPGMEGRIQVSA